MYYRFVCNIAFIFSLLVLFTLPTDAEVEINSATRAAQAESCFGLNGTKIFHIPGEIETTVEKRAELMLEAGVLWDRIDFWWHVIEPEKGIFDFSRPDQVVEYLESKGIQLYPILCYGAAWFEEGKTAPVTGGERKDFADFVYRVIDRYQDHFTYWAIWNEPNIMPFWTPTPNADDYAELLKKAHAAAKKADPECLLGAPVVAPLAGFDRKFTERLYQQGCKDYFDVFDYHYYRHGNPELEVPQEIAEIRALMSRYNDNKPIWLSETGVPGNPADGPGAYERQAALVVRNQLLCLASGIERIFYFDLQNWDDEPGSWDSKLGLVEADGDRKPAYRAYKTLVKEVDYKDVVGLYKGFGDDVWSALIHDPSTGIFSLAVWTLNEEDEKEVEVVCLPEDVKIVDPYGEVEIQTLENPPLPGMENRKVPLKVTQNPRYISPVDPALYLPDAGIQVDPLILETAPEEKHGIKLDISPLLEPNNVRILNIQTPDGITYNEATDTIKIGENVPAGEYEVEFNLQVFHADPWNPAATALTRKCKVRVTPTLKLGLRPYLEEGNLKILATVANQSSKPLSGDLELFISIDDEEWPLAEASIQRLEFGQEKEFELDIEDETVRSMTRPGALHLELNGDRSEPFRIHLIPRADLPVEVDGNLEEWVNVPKLQIDRESQIVRGAEGWTPEEASAEVGFKISEDWLYVGAEVTDDGPVFNENPANLIWKGDTFEIYLGFAGPTRRTVLDKAVEFQIGAAPTYEEGEPVVFLFHEDRILPSAKIEARETEEGYVLEAAIPLSELQAPGPFQPGDLLGLDVALDDLDEGEWAPVGNDPGRALMWNGSGMNWIDPSGWGMGVVVE